MNSAATLIPIVAKIVLVRPILRELLNRRELHTLGVIGHGLSFRPLRGADTLMQIGEVGLMGLEMKRANSGVAGHSVLLRRRLRLQRGLRGPRQQRCQKARCAELEAAAAAYRHA